MSREEDHKRVSAMAGLDEHGSILPPPDGATIDQSPSPYWKTKDYGEKCPLNTTDLKVIARMANGESAKQIAHAMGLTVNSIYWCVKSAKLAVGAKKDTELVAIALRKGWII